MTDAQYIDRLLAANKVMHEKYVEAVVRANDLEAKSEKKAKKASPKPTPKPKISSNNIEAKAFVFCLIVSVFIIGYLTEQWNKAGETSARATTTRRK